MTTSAPERSRSSRFALLLRVVAVTGAVALVAGPVAGSARLSSLSGVAPPAAPGPSVRARPTITSAPAAATSPAAAKTAPTRAVARARRAAAVKARTRTAKTAATKAAKARAKALLANPATSVLPTAAFGVACYGQKAAVTCDPVALAAINSARAGEHLPAVVLPANFESRSISSQLVWIANAERTVRGVPAMAQNATLDAEAAAGAKAGVDPQGPNGYDWGSNIAWGYATPLAADFAWMYDDGPGGTNEACTATVKTGCWGHRTNILLAGRGSSGAGSSLNQGRPQLTEVFAPRFT
jgi:hypothetical protein